MRRTTKPIVGIYCIRREDRFYVGQSIHMLYRGQEHFYEMRRGKHPNTKLQRSWDKHRGLDFHFEIIEVCEVGELTLREQFWMDTLDAVRTGYNISPAAESTLGFRHSEQTKARLRELAQLRPPVSDETRQKMRLNMTGTEMSSISKQKISEANKGRRRTEEQRQQMSEASRQARQTRPSRVLSEQHKQKLTEARRKRAPTSESTRQKIQASRCGKTTSDETRQRMREAHLARWQRIRANHGDVDAD